MKGVVSFAAVPLCETRAWSRRLHQYAGQLGNLVMPEVRRQLNAICIV
jgi:hypothetical protein